MSAPILQQEIQKFIKTNTAIDHFRIDNISEFIDPQNALPFYFKFDYQEILELQKLSTTCKINHYKRSEKLIKTWLWEEARCGHRTLNLDFFQSPPYFHPTGNSFAFLAKKNPQWIKEHLNLFHVAELKELNIPDLPAPYKYLTALEINSMTALSMADPIVMTDKAYLKT